jgi:hypothetical protein
MHLGNTIERNKFTLLPFPPNTQYHIWEMRRSELGLQHKYDRILWGKGVIELGIVIWGTFVKIIKFNSFRLCLVIIINIYVMVLIENMLVAGISIPLLTDLQSRINTIFIQDTNSFLICLRNTRSCTNTCI